MNRTALSVIALAVGSVLIIGLFNIYRPAVSHLSHDVFSKVHINHLGLKVHTYKGLKYTNDHGNVEIIGGKLTDKDTDVWSNDGGGGLLHEPDTPSNLANAKTLKLDSVDMTHVTKLRRFLANARNLESIDLSGIDTSHIDNNGWGYADMFAGDSKLKHVDFGNNFRTSNNVPDVKFTNMFLSDANMQSVSGNVPPQAHRAFEHKTSYWPAV